MWSLMRVWALGFILTNSCALIGQESSLSDDLTPPSLTTFSAEETALAAEGSASAKSEISKDKDHDSSPPGSTSLVFPVVAQAEESISFVGDKETTPAGDACAACTADANSADPNMPAKLKKIPILGQWGSGFEWHTEDEEFSLQIHNLTQVDYRDYTEDFGPLDPQATFVIPRQWLTFNGKLTQPIDYYVTFAFGSNSLNLLDGYLNWHAIDDRLQIKLGRYKTPFAYEFYALPINGLVNPERSLFFNNFGLNRDLGAMAHGTIINKHLDYAFGIFNGSRNGFLDENNDFKDFAGYVNYKPFINDADSALQYFQFGGSTNVGNEDDQSAAPRVLRTVVPITGVNTLGVPFFSFAPSVRNYGPRTLWSMHAAWYHNSLSLIGEWQSGFQDYAHIDSTVRTNVPIDSFYVQAGYFVTGEKVTGRGVVQPLHPFDIRKGKRGPGAWEPFVRYNDLNLGQEILTLSDGKPWTNNVQTLNCGVNWYWNPNFKFVIEYERTWFGDEVFVTNSQTHQTNDGILIRTQIYF